MARSSEHLGGRDYDILYVASFGIALFVLVSAVTARSSGHLGGRAYDIPYV